VRSGAALASVLLALTMTSALAVGGVYLARTQLGATRAAAEGAPLQPAAERLVVLAVVSWDSTARASQPIASSTEIPIADGRVWITRLDERVYWLVAEAKRLGATSLSRRVGLVVRADSGRVRPVFPRGWAELPGDQ
jgi:hypothetical protein